MEHPVIYNQGFFWFVFVLWNSDQERKDIVPPVVTDELLLWLGVLSNQRHQLSILFNYLCFPAITLFSLCRQHIFKYRAAVWLVSVLSVRCQTHLGAVWLAIRTHCGSRSRLSYYCDDCCGAIFTNCSGLFVTAELGLSAPADQKQWDDFTTCWLLCLILDQILSDSVHQYWLT